MKAGPYVIKFCKNIALSISVYLMNTVSQINLRYLFYSIHLNFAKERNHVLLKTKKVFKESISHFSGYTVMHELP